MSTYFTDVPYVRQFCRELGPTLLHAAAALGGRRAPRLEGFSYCELGAGYGDTTATLAAAYPDCEFVGVDLNPDHVAFARGLAARGGLTNVRFVEGDLAELRGQGLPGFDFITAHGLLSWVGDETRAAVVAFAAQHLRPGGLLYVSYNALPGWACVAPLRKLLVDSAEGPGTLVERAARALEVARALRAAGAGYFAHNPAASEMLDTMGKLGPIYIAHEYLQPHWRPMYFAEVAAAMAGAGLRFAGQLPLHRNVPRLAVSGATRGALAAATDAVAAETLKDLANDTFFRGDVYVRSDAPADPRVAQEYLERTPFGTLVSAGRVAREIGLPHGPLSLAGPPFDQLIEALAARPATLTELAARPELRALGADRLREALVDLLSGEQIVPMRPRRTDEPPAVLYNGAILDEPLAEGRAVVLAAPRAGTGIALSAMQAVSLRLLTTVDPVDRDAWLRAYVARHALRLHVRERRVTDPSEQVAVLSAEVRRFETERLPGLRALGVVA